MIALRAFWNDVFKSVLDKVFVSISVFPEHELFWSVLFMPAAVYRESLPDPGEGVQRSSLASAHRIAS